MSEEATVARHEVDLGWGRVSYLEWGDPDAAAVLLLHGGGVDNAELSWRLLGPALADAGYRVVAPDHPGYGHSPAAPWAAGFERLVEYVQEFVSALGLRDYAVGGVSMGGGMTLGHALARPAGPRALLLFDSYGLTARTAPGMPGQLLMWALVRTGAVRALTRRMSSQRAAVAASLASIVRNPKQRTDALVDEVFAAATAPGAGDAFAQFQRDQVRWNRNRTDLRSRLAEIAQPTLVVHGDADDSVPVTAATAAAKALPDAQLLVVHGAGHWVQRDQPDVVNPAVVGFLDAHR